MEISTGADCGDDDLRLHVGEKLSSKQRPPLARGPDLLEVEVQRRVAERIVEAADRIYEAALSGKEQVLPVSQEDAPAMIRTYLDLTLNQTIQQRILELVAPMLEQVFINLLMKEKAGV